MGVKFLSQGNNSSRNPQLGIEPGTSQLPGQLLSRLLLPPSKDEWDTKEGTGKSMKNALHVQWYGKRYLSG